MHNEAMPEPVITLCPNCGRRVNVEPYHDRATCGSCGQLIQVWQPHGATGKSTRREMQAVAPPPDAVGMTATGSAAGKRALWLILTPALVIAAVGAVVLAVVMPRPEPPKPPPDFFGDARAIPDQLVRELGFPVMVQRLTLYPTHADVEVWSATERLVRHYKVRPDGMQRRGTAEPDGARVFDASDLAVARIPALVADARGSAADAQVIRVVIERAPDEAVIWRVHASSGGQVYTVEYDDQGNRRSGPAQ